jgi:hypothetical protein
MLEEGSKSLNRRRERSKVHGETTELSLMVAVRRGLCSCSKLLASPLEVGNDAR